VKKKESETTKGDVTRRVVLTGKTPIMFDRYAGDNQTKLLWWQKVYLLQGSNMLCMPTANITSFLSSHNTNSAPKRLRDVRKYKAIANACLSFVIPSGPDEHPDMIPILKDGEPIRTGDPKGEIDKTSGLRLHRSVARLEKGIPNPKERALLPLPWALDFNLTITRNKEIKEQEIRNLFEEGGIAIGLGTFRGVFGKFEITCWE